MACYFRSYRLASTRNFHWRGAAFSTPITQGRIICHDQNTRGPGRRLPEFEEKRGICAVGAEQDEGERQGISGLQRGGLAYRRVGASRGRLGQVRRVRALLESYKERGEQSVFLTSPSSSPLLSSPPISSSLPLPLLHSSTYLYLLHSHSHPFYLASF